MSLELHVNGERKTYGDGDFPASVLQLLESLGIDAGMVVAEVNGDIVGRKSFADHILSSGDRVEVVRFVGGG